MVRLLNGLLVFFLILDLMNEKSKIVIISKSIYPFNNPRSHRATELAKEFGRQGYEVVLYGEKANIDYTLFERKYKIKLRDLGKLYFSSSYFKNKLWKKIISGLSIILNKLIEFNIQKGVAANRDSFFVNYTDKENGPLSIRLFLLLLYIINSEHNYGADSNC